MSEMLPFIHLRIHTAYSLCEGAVKVSSLVKECTNNKMPACAISDTNNMFGVLDFALQCSSSGIQPITACQLDVSFTDIIAPIVLIAKNETGYKNILKLITCHYYKFPINIENLREHRNGVIALSGGYKGPAGVLFLRNTRSLATDFLNKMSSIFADNFYIEISRTHVVDESKTEDFFVNYALDKNIPLVATNEVFFLNKDMHSAQDILMCISDGTYASEQDRRHVSQHCYLKNTEEMYELFNDLPEAVINTSLIAKRCGFMPEEHPPMLPRFDDGSGNAEEDILEKQAKEGLKRRIDEEIVFYEKNRNREKEEIEREYTERLNYECSVIKNMGFCGYFLIVSDFVKWAKNHNIPVGPGRGSGAGSVVAWCLYITDLDPIKYNLIFERFLNPDRISMPDFDIDFCQDRRDEVIGYVKEKYGKDKVAHIIALGTLQARAVLRDVGRVIQMPYGQVDKISKLVPQNPAHPVDLEKALEIEPMLTNMMEEDESVNFLIKTGLQLEGLYRHASVHAAGVVIGQSAIDEIVPIYNDGESDMAITQFNMKFVEKAGLVKFDFLGLKTLTMIKQACDLVDLNISKIPLNDPKTFKLMQDANVMGVFQLESSGMRDVIQKLQPDNLEDIIALISLYRPGPMDSIPTYLARKHGEEQVIYLHPSIESILSTTYGIMIYQEQVMKIAQVMGGYTLAQADLLRRAMGKKIPEEMAKHRQLFVNGAKENGIDENVADTVFSQMEKFAGYGFNRSHAAAYAVISYQTAYLKANYLHEFYVALMNLEIANTDKIATYVQDARMNNIKVLQPDINKSQPTFKREDNCLRYALGAIKGSSVIVTTEMGEEREKNGDFKDFSDFFHRISKKCMNKRQIETLIMAGAFDSLNRNRYQVLSQFHNLSSERNANSGQKSLFAAYSKEIEIPNVPDWNAVERLEKERSSIGFYLSAHPMDEYVDFLNTFDITRSSDFATTTIKQITTAGILLSKQEKLSKNAQKYCFLQVSDQDNTFEITVMPDLYLQSSGILVIGTPLLINITIKNVDGIVRMTANSIQNIDNIIKKQKVYLELDSNADIDSLHKLLSNIEAGDNKISFIIQTNSIRKTEIETKYTKNINMENRKKIKNIRGVSFYITASKNII